MREINNLDGCFFNSDDQVVLAIGMYDGLHGAHRLIIEECKNRAVRREGTSVIFTFQNHPASILHPDKAPLLLTPYTLKRKLIEQMGIDILIGIPFDLELSHIPARDFIERILIKQLAAKEIVIGYNFRFGYLRQGNSELLKEYAPDQLEDVDVIEQQTYDSEVISSTFIRQKVLSGDLNLVQRLLDRPYQIAGTVVRGAGRGRKIGIPTANINTEGQALPPNGVYGVRIRVEELDAPPLWGVMNIGTVPTFTDQSVRSTEIHILDFNEDVYGKYLIIDIIERIRDEKRFSGPSELITQIYSDINYFKARCTALSKV